MTPERRQQIEALLANPDALLDKRPFYRGVSLGETPTVITKVDLTGKERVGLPKVKLTPVTQAMFVEELDVHSHKVLFDKNVPAITIRTEKDGYLEMEQYRMGVPFQVLIRNKQVRHLCVNKMNQTLLNQDPTERQSKDFVRIKQAWAERNMEGAKTQFVQDQKSYGDAALLFYLDDDMHIQTRNINYADGYVIVTHKDKNGKHILECLYYQKDDVEYIDCYDDEYITRFTSETSENSDGGWTRYPSVPHGFSENPLITKRGDVAWNNGQSIIDSYEALYNTFIVIQKRFGWGILYVKGKLDPNARKVAGNVVLCDTSMDENADAKMLNPPSPSNLVETLKAMKESIEIATGTTFILPEDIKISGDASGLAIEMTQELDLATAQDGVTEWQNVANKMMRLFVEGLSIELVNTGEQPTAITDFSQLRIHNEFVVWRPQSKETYNNMLISLKGAGLLSTQTGVEKNTESTPDEYARITRETEEAQQQELALQSQANNTTVVEDVVTDE